MDSPEKEAQRQELTRRLVGSLSPDEETLTALEKEAQDWLRENPDDMLVGGAASAFGRRLSLWRAHRNTI